MRVAFLVLVGGALFGCGGPSPVSTPQGSASDFFASSGASLRYALDLPSGPGPFPAVVIGHGAGAVTLDEGAIHVPFLKAAGFAVLRYDKRGAGLSTGIYQPLSGANSETVVAELGGDMVAGVNFLKTRADIDPRRIGFAGVSQAGWIMVAGAQRSADVKFIIAIVGPTTPVGTNVYYEGLPSSASLDANYAALAAFNGRPGWDPKPTLQRLQIPALWLLGEGDRIVPTRVVTRDIQDLQDQGHHCRSIVYAGFGHELSGSASRYWPDALAWMSSEGLR